MKKFLSIILAVVMLCACLLTMTSCGKVEGKIFEFSHVKMKWAKDATSEQKQAWVDFMSVFTADEVTEDNVLEKYEAYLTKMMEGHSYAFEDDGNLKGSLGTWEKDGKNITIKAFGADAVTFKLSFGRLVSEAEDGGLVVKTYYSAK